MNQVFNTSILIGLTIPAINAVTGTLGEALDFALDVDTTPDGFIPFNIMSICASLIVFGSVGRLLMFGTMSKTKICAISFTLGALTYYIVCNFIIKKLRASNPEALKYDEIIGKTGLMVLRATKTAYGTVSVIDSTGGSITYKALVSSTYEDDKIEQGANVTIDTYGKKRKRMLF